MENSAGLWRWCNVKSTSLSLAQKVFWRQKPCWRWAAQWMNINNTDRWQHSTGKRTYSIWSKINSQNDCWWNEHEPGNRSFDTDWRIGDQKNLCQDGAQESPEQRLDVRLSVVFDIQMHYSDAAASFVTWSRTLRLLFISKSKIGGERTPFWVNIRHL